MVIAISDSRVVPVTEDLTTEVSTLEILRGLETMYRVDKPLAIPGTTALLMGEFAVLNSAGKAERAGATPKGQTYLVFAGTDRFDVKATGQVTLIMSWPIQAKTSRYNTGGSYAVGDLLTVKNLGGGQSQLTPASSTEFAVARVLEVGTGYLVYETLGGGSVEV